MKAWMPRARPTATAMMTISSTTEAVVDFERFLPALPSGVLEVLTAALRRSGRRSRLAGIGGGVGVGGLGRLGGVGCGLAGLLLRGRLLLRRRVRLRDRLLLDVLRLR